MDGINISDIKSLYQNIFQSTKKLGMNSMRMKIMVYTV